MSIGGIFRMPVRSADIWGLNDPDGSEKRDNEDIAADLDYQDNAIENFLSDSTSPENVPTFGSSLDRGRESATMPAATKYTSAAVFVSVFPAAPRVVLTVECGRAQDLRVILTSVTTSGFGYQVTAPTSSTTTLFVHWVAVQT